MEDPGGETASAPPSRTAATKSAGPAAPPEAITGTGPARRSRAADRCRSPTCVPSRSIEVTSSSPAPSSTARTAQAMASRPVGSRPPLTTTSNPDGGAGSAPAPAGRRSRRPRPGDPNRAAHRETRSGSATARVFRPTLSAPARSTSRISSTRAHAAADGQRDERPPRRALDDVEQRPAALGRGGDVEEHELVGALAGVALGELGRVALVDEVDEAGALHDAAVGDVEARDHAAAEHQAATPGARRRGGERRRRSRAAAGRRRRERSGWNWTPSSRPRATARHEPAAVLGLGERRGVRAAGGRPDVRVDEVEVGAVGDAVEGRVRRGGARPGSSRCAAASARPRGRTVRPGRTPSVSAPSSSLPSNSSWSPRQMPRYGRSAAIQARIGSTKPPARSRSIAGAAAPTPGTTSRSGSAISAAVAARWTGADRAQRLLDRRGCRRRSRRPRRAGRPGGRRVTRASPWSRRRRRAAGPARMRRGARGRAP